MKVLVTEPAGYGGTAYYAYELVKSLKDAGTEVILATSQNCEFQGDTSPFLLSPVFSKYSAAKNKIISAYYYASALIKIWQLSSREKIDLFHLRWPKLLILDCILIKLLQSRGVRILTTADNVLPHEMKFYHSLVNRLLYRLCDCMIVHTNFDKTFLKNHWQISEDKIRVVPHGNMNGLVSCLDKDPAVTRKEMGLKSGDTLFLFFGQIRPYKGLQVLLKGFARCAGDLKKCRLAIVGELKEPWVKYETLIHKLGLDKTNQLIVRHGFIPLQEMLSWLSASDAVILPYTKISQSGVAILAASMGKPVIASRVGGVPEIVEHGKDGFLFTPSDEDALAGALIELSCDKQRLKRLGAHFRKKAQNEWSWQLIAKNTTDLYRQLLEHNLR
jgi:glycosyltransferase involved in cell wall biosynthesis